MTEIRALLLTDVVDSTKLSERLGDVAMAALWTAHDRVARDLLGPHRGREIDKTDGFLLLFDAAGDAAAYAVAYHRALRALDLEARAGLHVGAVILRENTAADVARGAKPLEVEGLAKPTAARVMGLASGGQTLLTAQAHEALGSTSLRSESHGHWRMKGVAEPVEIFEVGEEDAPFAPPPDGAKVYRVVRQGDLWAPVGEIPHNLPRERDAFVGREADLQEVARRLDGGAALVSVLGTGGTGKTRLVTRYAWTWLGDWPGGVWFCDLSEAREVDGVVSAVAQALGVPLNKDPIVQLGHAIAARGRGLVILDNFEQVARYAPDTLGRWLDRAQEARFVVTTREVLGLAGETTLALAPLDRADSVALFEARAVQAKRDFVLSGADRPAVVELVRLLDGLPLAIELAAARVRVMPPKMLLQRMSERFKLLSSTGGRHTRQATLRAALDWSWDLLGDDEKAALAQLSVFEGGFTLAAAEAVLALEEAWPVDVVQALVDKSLVRRVSDERFDLLVSVQEYAAERLGEGRADAEVRHGRHYAALGSEEALAALERHGGSEPRERLARELDNLSAAIRSAVARRDEPVAMGALQALWQVLWRLGPFAAAADQARSVLEMPGLSEPARARSSHVLGRALQNMGRYADALARYEAALAAHREGRAGGDRRAANRLLADLGSLQFYRGRPDEAAPLLEEALSGARAIGDRDGERIALAFQGVLAERGRPVEARAKTEAALQIARELGDRRSEGALLSLLGNLRLHHGARVEARAHYEAALVAAQETLDNQTLGIIRCNLGWLNVEEGRLPEARAAYESAMDLARAMGDRRSEGLLLRNLGDLLTREGRFDAALESFEAAMVVAIEVGDRRQESILLSDLGSVTYRAGRYEETRPRWEASVRISRELGDQATEASTTYNLGELNLETGRPEEAIVCFEAARAIIRAVGDPRLEPDLADALARARARTGASSGP